ncbi:response regulator [Paenibacillus sp. y28]|uniref:response regulator n=1 Tax=Paenibacillus sp. y28 TaxID=3129110 RepID=UPI003015E098
MYRLLVVDDEPIAVRGITRGINWNDLNVGLVLEALDVEEAKLLLKEQQVDIVISDIEMPGEDGLNLLSWVKQHSPGTETIFLTGHANFAYAQKAVQLGSYDYILKPVDHAHLKQIVAGAIQKLQAEREQQQWNEMYKSYYKQWQDQLPSLVERFWLDVLEGRIPPLQERLERDYGTYELPLSAGSKLLPILLSVEAWQAEWSAKDEDIMEYALRKAAGELILHEYPGCVFPHRSGGYNLVLLYLPDAPEALLPQDVLKRRCREYIEACRSYFYCGISCYIGESATAAGLPEAVHRLLEAERRNISGTADVVCLQEEKTGGSAAPAPFPLFTDWIPLLESGQTAEVLARLDSHMDILERDGDAESLEALYFSLLHAVYQVALKKGLSVRGLLPDQLKPDSPAPARSVPQLRVWVIRLAEAFTAYLGSCAKSDSAVIAKVKQLITEQLHTELSREELASRVYLNPAYLSRLFKKETGASLSEFALQTRMEEARRRLSGSHDKISSIAEAVGYTHFSHFAKMFKRVTGLSPQDYRKLHQD